MTGCKVHAAVIEHLGQGGLRMRMRMRMRPKPNPKHASVGHTEAVATLTRTLSHTCRNVFSTSSLLKDHTICNTAGMELSTVELTLHLGFIWS